ncbi:MAG: hypothetical protein Q8O52_09030 [Sulfuritalea sp.]|nr:hypothetical protein [Sulfuritalea sp.]
MKLLRSRAVEQIALSSPLRILAVADGDTALKTRTGAAAPVIMMLSF